MTVTVISQGQRHALSVPFAPRAGDYLDHGGRLLVVRAVVILVDGCEVHATPATSEHRAAWIAKRRAPAADDLQGAVDAIADAKRMGKVAI